MNVGNGERSPARQPRIVAMARRRRARLFLETCLDQIRFMEGLVQPARLRERILTWAEEEARHK